MKKTTEPLVLVVLDGWGIAPASEGNAIHLAKTPTLDAIKQHYPYSVLKAAGKAVGLFENIIGNSEVGHMNLGAGRVVSQDLVNISRSIDDKSFFKNPVLKKAFSSCQKRKSTLHLMGLLSDGGVHSYIEHVFALLDMAKQEGVTHVHIHLFTDGRDTPPRSALGYIRKLEDKIKQLGLGRIASISGRWYAMDRINQWKRLERVYRAIVHGQGPVFRTPSEAVENAYEKNLTDEWVEPAVIRSSDSVDKNEVSSNDSVIFFNLRSDRARQLTKAFVQKEFNGFSRHGFLSNIVFIAFTDFGDDLDVETAFLTKPVQKTISQVLEKHGLSHLYIAEEEKFAHVTYFFHGSISTLLPHEDRVKVSSRAVSSYVKTPEMSAQEVTDVVIKSLQDPKGHHFILVNYANADMIGHTGNINACVKACEFIDWQLKRLLHVALKRNVHVIITADHGNAEHMIDLPTGQPLTAHTVNDVPFHVISPRISKGSLQNGKLADVSPTALKIIDIEQPTQMTGQALF